MKQRLVAYIDSGDRPLPAQARTVDIQHSDMESTRAQANKVVDHLLQDMTLAQGPPVSEPSGTAWNPELPPRSQKRETVTAGRKGGERSAPKRSAKRTAKKRKR